ncbi:MAG: suppressor of fused domain protein [Verrucomicrobiota bacterium]
MKSAFHQRAADLADTLGMDALSDPDRYPAEFPAITLLRSREPGFISRLIRRIPPQMEIAFTSGCAELANNAVEFIAVTSGSDEVDSQQCLRVVEEFAQYSMNTDVSFDVGHTADLVEVLGRDFPARYFLLLPPPDSSTDKLFLKCLAPAATILSILPISSAEYRMIRERGLGDAIDEFERHDRSMTFTWPAPEI